MKTTRTEDASTLADASEATAPNGQPTRWVRTLVVVWSREEPERIGEVVTLPRGTQGVAFSIGRARSVGDDGALPLEFVRLRPCESETRGPLQAARVSRRHLRLKVVDGALEVTHPGRGRLAVNGQEVACAQVREGDIIESVGRLMLLVSRRPAHWAHQPRQQPVRHFGIADPSGIVGESVATWELRRQLQFAARHRNPVLVHGASGSGKELVVNAIHTASRFATRPLVARNAATLPEGLIDAELFGNLKNYPNPGMPERPGLLGEADGSSLFLDEIGELPQAMQAHLLRVMDSGEYQRLGEARRRVTRARLIGATNRDLSELKHDLLARFSLRVCVRGLNERREDIMLIARHLVRTFASEDPLIRDQFFAGDEPRFDPQFVRQLVQAEYSTHVRELAEYLWRSIAASTGPSLESPPGLAQAKTASESPPADIKKITRAQVVAALERCDGVRERAWRELGLRSRHQLKRLMKRFQLS